MRNIWGKGSGSLFFSSRSPFLLCFFRRLSLLSILRLRCNAWVAFLCDLYWSPKIISY